VDELEETLLQGLNIQAFKLSLFPDSKLKFSNAGVFDGLVTALSWNAVHVNADDVRALICGNTRMSEIIIINSSVSELQCLSMLAASLQSMSLDDVAFDDEQLAALCQDWTSLRELSMTGREKSTCRLGAGLAAVAKGLSELRSLSVYEISVSDEAVVAFCRHCPKLTSVLLPDAFLTTEAVEELIWSGARWQGLEIGWKVGSSAAGGVMRGITSFTVVFVLPAYAVSLEEALGCMTALTSFSVGHWCQQKHPFPAHVLMGLVRSRAVLTSLTVSCPLFGESVRVLTAVLSG
jgi:hypothetical protein